MNSLRIDICAYDNADGVGGPFVWVQRMCRELVARGMDVRVRLFHWGPLEEGMVYQGLKRDGIPLTSHAFADSQSNVRWLLKCVAVEPPAVLIADNVIPALLAGRYLRQAHIPTVAILRSDDAFYHAVTERFVVGDRADQVTAVVCVSQFLAKTVSTKSNGSARVTCIPSGTPIPAKAATLPTETFNVIYVGRIVQEQKRIVETVRALHRVVTELPNISATLFGDGPDFKMVESLLSSMCSPVRLAGRLDSDSLQERLLQSHVIVLLSDYEGTPTAVMEAMACGVVPVCLSIRSGIPELITHNETGLLVDDREDDLVNAIRRLQTEAGLWTRLSANAKQRAEDGFSFEKSADKWEILLRNLSAGTHGNGRFRMPTRLKLAAPHPAFAQEDRRMQGILGQSLGKFRGVVSRARVLGGRLKRKLRDRLQ
jgi:colanic acid/amylovoran biosynthesis glycosyltransferase